MAAEVKGHDDGDSQNNTLILTLHGNTSTTGSNIHCTCYNKPPVTEVHQDLSLTCTCYMNIQVSIRTSDLALVATASKKSDSARNPGLVCMFFS